MPISKITKQIMNRLNNALTQPWKLKMEPYQVVPNVYYVGNKYVGSYLFNTDKGIILIDVGMQETAYLLFESIRKIGFSPEDIKTILISHGHIDHCGAARLVQEYSKSGILFPQGDAFFLTERRDLILRDDLVPSFEIKGYYDYGKFMNFGNVEILPVITPGHTPGCTSFIIKVASGDKIITLGMHGGLGLNGLTKAELKEKGLALDLQEKYLKSLQSIREEKVDIVIPSHASHFPGDYFAIAAKNDGTGKVLMIPHAWQNLMDDRIRQIKEIIEHDN